MLIQPSKPRTENLPYTTQRLWNDSGTFTPSLGCTNCPDKAICGGLAVASDLYDCLHFCCGSPSGCDAVCRNKPEEFAQRVREVGGFSLENVPRAELLAFPELPTLVPVVFHGNKRTLTFAGPDVICLPMSKVVEARAAVVRFKSPQHLRDTFGLGPNARVILTGTSTDSSLERWWSFGNNRADAIQALKMLGITLVTTPNYSLFTDQPRWDDLHSMKRIALVHQEFLSAGMPAALHVNARTERDWDRWGEFIASRPEITHVAFEFATGAGGAGRIQWHAEQLTKLRMAVGRPLNLVVRGGITIMPRLFAVFEKVTCLETSIFLKTMRRKAAVLRADGAVRWKHAPTAQDETLDALLNHNWTVVLESYRRVGLALSSRRKAA
jgi:hypothetical protein